MALPCQLCPGGCLLLFSPASQHVAAVACLAICCAGCRGALPDSSTGGEGGGVCARRCAPAPAKAALVPACVARRSRSPCLCGQTCPGWPRTLWPRAWWTWTSCWATSRPRTRPCARWAHAGVCLCMYMHVCVCVCVCGVGEGFFTPSDDAVRKVGSRRGLCVCLCVCTCVWGVGGQTPSDNALRKVGSRVGVCGVWMCGCVGVSRPQAAPCAAAPRLCLTGVRLCGT